jgi:hypothetical protein
MKRVELSKLPQVYSYIQSERPVEAWALLYKGGTHPSGVHGIPQEVINQIENMSSYWTGWAFDNDALLLFESRDDAVLAKMTMGEKHV